jgi:hypothetical protein
MVTKLTIESEVTGSGISVKRDIGLTKAIKASQQLYSLSRKNAQYRGELTSLAVKLNSIVEKAVVDSLGGTRIVGKTGSGFQPDFYVRLPDDSIEAREQKIVAIKETDGKLIRTKEVKLAGGEGIQLSSGTQSFLKGLSVDENGNVVENVETVKSTNLFNQLIKAGSSEEIKKIISGSGKANTLLRQNILLKAKNIDIPLTFQGVLQNRTIQFSWSDILKNPLIKIAVTPKEDSSLTLQVYFSAGIITKALNNANKVIINNIDDTLSKKYLQIIEELFTLPNTQSTREFKAWLKSQDYDFGISYIPGSAVVSRGVVEGKQTKKVSLKKSNTKSQKIISDAQMSLLIQKETEKRMPKGPLRGPPLSPTVLTYRTGTFVASIKVIQDYREKLIKYYYAPNYKIHERRGARAPRLLVQSSIRSVVQEVYAEKFRILRGF